MNISYSDEDFSKDEEVKQTRQNYGQSQELSIIEFDEVDPSPKLENEENLKVSENPLNQAKLTSLRLNEKNNIIIQSTINLRSCKKERFLLFPQASEKVQKGRVSDFKNLGKALVKLLRRIINEDFFPTTSDTVQTVKDLWAIFKRSIPNITMASAVLGSIQNFSYPSLTKLGFKRVIQKRNPLQIIKAQALIRKGILDQIQQLNIDEEIDKSKVAAKDKFKKYMHARLAEMRNGTFKQRISQQTFQNNDLINDEEYLRKVAKRKSPPKRKNNRLTLNHRLMKEKRQRVKEHFSNDTPQAPVAKIQQELFQEDNDESMGEEKEDFFNYEEDQLKIEQKNQNLANHQSDLQDKNEGLLQYSLDMLADSIEAPWVFE